MEQLSLHRLQVLHPSIRESAISAYNKAVQITPQGVHPFVTQTLRTFSEQDYDYSQGRTRPGNIITKARGGQSYHNYGLALDFVLQINGKFSWKVDANWVKVANCFKDYGFEWGGDWKSFKDYPHVQKLLGHTWRDLLQKHNSNQFIEGTTYVKL